MCSQLVLAGRIVRDAAHAHPTELPQLLPTGGALAVQRHPPGARRLTAMPPQRDAYASIRQRAARALLESTTLDGAVAEILRTISNELEWPLAIYWIAGADDRRLHCRSIWVAETLKRADVVEASRIAIVSRGRRGRSGSAAPTGGGQPVWIEHLAGGGARLPARGWLWRSTRGCVSSAAFPIADARRRRRRDRALCAARAPARTTRCWP